MKNNILILCIALLLLFSCKQRLLIGETVEQNGVVYHNGKPYSGILLDMGSDAKPNAEYEFKDGLLEGKSVHYNTDEKQRGNITKVENYTKGKLDGEYIEYSTLLEYHNDINIHKN